MQEERNLTFRERFPRPKAPLSFKHEFENKDDDEQLCETMDNLLDEEYENETQEEDNEDEDDEGDSNSDDDSNSENDMDDS